MDYILTLKPSHKEGVKMRAEIYQSIKSAMLGLLHSKDGVPSQLFFRVLHDQFKEILGGNTGWYLYQVKVDIEVRGIIRTLREKKRSTTTAVIMLVQI